MNRPNSNKKLMVAIQGVEGCFHDAAAHEYFKDTPIEAVECETFEDLFSAMEDDASMVAIVAIENTIAGSLLQNHELLRKSALTVIGEHKIRISHVLTSLDEDDITTITEVNSHPMALLQCEHFLKEHPDFRKVEKYDTAGAAKEIRDKHLVHHAAICSEYAANLYGMKILQKSIETNKRNFTRFLVLADPLLAGELKTRPEDCDKASIVFTLPHTQGALSKVLTILSFYDINLDKIQSMPIIGREWEYRFYVDVTFKSYIRYRQSLDAVRPLLNDFRILGEYKAFVYDDKTC